MSGSCWSVGQRDGRWLDRLVLTCCFPPQGSLSVSQLQQVETCVNNMISANQIVHSQELPLHRARTIRGLRMVDEVNNRDLSHSLHHCLTVCRCTNSLCLQVYPDPVRVVSVGVEVSELLEDQTDRQTSVELCCGT